MDLIDTLPDCRCVYLYGSGARHIESARDIDILCIDDRFVDSECRSGYFRVNGANKRTNAYFISATIFREDCERLAWGGYYAHKFALSAKCLRNAGSPEFLELFWWTELKSIQEFGVDLSHDTVSRLIRASHYRILHFNPTFYRSLKRYLESAGAIHALEEQVEISLGKSSGIVEFPNAERWAQSLFRFWREYHRHKDSGEFPGHNTQRKFARSIGEANFEETNGYFAILSEDDRRALRR